MTHRFLFAVVLCAGLALACDETVSPRGTGGITLHMVTPEGTAEYVNEPVDSVSVWLRSSDDYADAPYRLEGQGGVYSSTIDGLEPGDYRVVFEALLHGDVAYYGAREGVPVRAGIDTPANIQITEFAVPHFVIDTTAFSFEVSWGSPNGASSYELEWSPEPLFPVGSTPVPTDSNTGLVEVGSLNTYQLQIWPVNGFGHRGWPTVSTVLVVPDYVGAQDPSAADEEPLVQVDGVTTKPYGVLNIPDPSEVDWFGFEACPGDTVTIETRAARLDPQSRLDTELTLFAASAPTSQLAYNDDEGTSTDSRIGSFPLNGRRYLFTVGGIGSVGHYELDLTLNPGGVVPRIGCTLPAPETHYVLTSNDVAPLAGSSVTITAQLADISGNPVGSAGHVVTWSSTNGGTFSTATSTTDASGLATVGFTTSSTSGTTHSVTAIDGAGLAGTIDIITTGVAAETQYVVGSSDVTPTAGSSVVITAQLADISGNPVSSAGHVVTWSSTNGGAFVTPTSTTNASGTATVVFTISSTVGTTHTVMATDGDGLTGAVDILTTGAVTATQYIVEVSNVTPIAGSPVVITAQLADISGNGVGSAGRVVTWSSTNGGSIAPATSTTDAGGRATSVFTTSSTAFTTHTVTATDGGGLTGTSQSITTQSAQPPVPEFKDGFETGDLSHTDNDLEWLSFPSPPYASVVSSIADSGTYSAEFDFGDFTSGLDARLYWQSAGSYNDVWLEYDIYFPDETDVGLGSAAYVVDNGVAHALRWRYGLEAYVLGATFEPPEISPTDNFARLVARGRNSIPLANTDGGAAIGFEIPKADRGSWQQFRWHVKMASDVGVQDGVQEFWYNGVQRFFRTNLDIMILGFPEFDNGHLMGLGTTRFTGPTKVFIDNVKFYTTNPGW